MLLLLWNAPSTGVPPEPPVVAGGTYAYRFPAPYVIDDTDEDYLMIWLTFMQRYYAE
jgi:hypothetical protein